MKKGMSKRVPLFYSMSFMMRYSGRLDSITFYFLLIWWRYWKWRFEADGWQYWNREVCNIFWFSKYFHEHLLFNTLSREKWTVKRSSPYEVYKLESWLPWTYLFMGDENWAISKCLILCQKYFRRTECRRVRSSARIFSVFVS